MSTRSAAPPRGGVVMACRRDRIGASAPPAGTRCPRPALCVRDRRGRDRGPACCRPGWPAGTCQPSRRFRRPRARRRATRGDRASRRRGRDQRCGLGPGRPMARPTAGSEPRCSVRCSARRCSARTSACWSPAWPPARCSTRSWPPRASPRPPRPSWPRRRQRCKCWARRPGSAPRWWTAARPGPAPIVLVGGGDPTLAAGKPPAGDYPQPATLAGLAARTAAGCCGPAARTACELGYDTSLYTGPAWRPAGRTAT